MSDRLTNHPRDQTLGPIHLMLAPVVLPPVARSKPSCGSRVITWVRSPDSFRPRRHNRPPWPVTTTTSMTAHVTPDQDPWFTISIRHISVVSKTQDARSADCFWKFVNLNIHAEQSYPIRHKCCNRSISFATLFKCRIFMSRKTSKWFFTKCEGT